MADIPPSATMKDEDALELSGLQVRLVASEFLTAIAREDALERIEVLDALFNDLIECYVGLKVAVKDQNDPKPGRLH